MPDSSYAYWVDSLKRTAKVYRKIFPQIKDTKELIEDVSEKYGLTDSVVIQMKGMERHVWLCTYRTGSDWKEAVKGKVVNGRCLFRNLGNSIVYLPAIQKNGVLVALDAPFVLNKGGTIRKIIPTENKQTVRLNRKYILMTNWTNRWSGLIGGHFEASNDSSFYHAKVLHRISQFPVYRNEVKLQELKSYRYVRYVSPGISKSALAELSFFCEKKELKGKIMGEGLTPPSRKRVFDHNLMTIGDPKTESYWVGLDLGKRHHLDSIVYYPRNDDNFITPGDSYELFYYDKGTWHSLGVMIAESEELIYEEVLENALFLLKNITKGEEERIFTYENDRQVWW